VPNFRKTKAGKKNWRPASTRERRKRLVIYELQGRGGKQIGGRASKSGKRGGKVSGFWNDGRKGKGRKSAKLDFVGGGKRSIAEREKTSE